jgi:hypothetical protein
VRDSMGQQVRWIGDYVKTRRAFVDPEHTD